MKKFLSLTLTLIILAGCFAVNVGAEELTFTPGTYTATVNGNVGPITVETVFSEHAIESVQVISQNETRIVSAPAIERIPKSIVEYQSLGVDAISSCTVTSAAIIYAVSECVKQAGGDASALRKVPVPKPEQKDMELEADVVVVGAGASGLAAANAAADSGKHVIVLERADVSGGTSALSGGMMPIIGLEGQEEKGINTTVEEMVDWWMQADETYSIRPYNPDIDYRANREFLLSHTVDVYHFLNEHNDPLCDNPIKGSSWQGIKFEYYSANRVDATDTYDSGGAEHTKALTENLAKYDNVDVYYSTRVTEITCEDGKVSGVIANGPSGKVTVKSPKVILATGGYSRNGELLQRFTGESPDFAPYTAMGIGATGDGIIMAEAIGAKVIEEGETVTLAYPLNAGFVKSAINSVKGVLIIDGNGKRAANFNVERVTFIDQFEKAYNETGRVLELHDANSDTAAVLEENLSSPSVFKADSIEELAGLLNIDPAVLKETVDTYNAYCDAGEDPEFGQTTLTRIDTAPFYATKHMLANIDTYGGVMTNMDYEVLNTDGEVIEGLYAVGSMAFGKFVNQYHMSGASLLNCMVSGMTAGTHATK